MKTRQFRHWIKFFFIHELFTFLQSTLALFLVSDLFFDAFANGELAAALTNLCDIGARKPDSALR